MGLRRTSAFQKGLRANQMTWGVGGGFLNEVGGGRRRRRRRKYGEKEIGVMRRMEIKG